jgi:glycosyltransferase involved in cell wall biosynthesis
MTRLTRLIAPSTVLVTSAHNVDEGASWRMWVYRATDRLTNLTTNVSPAAVARSIERGAAPPARIRYMPNGIDTARFKADAELRACVRRELALGDRFVWLCVASLERQKDYPNLFGALQRLKDHAARPLVLAVGVGSLHRELETMASSQVPEMVRFLGARADVPALMVAADAYVLSSAWEGLPVVLLEASASCLPIVCTDVGGNREIVRDGETGYVVQPASSAILAEAMAKVMDSSADQRASLGRRARAHVDASFSLYGVAARWERIYTELFERAGGKARRLDLPRRRFV